MPRLIRVVILADSEAANRYRIKVVKAWDKNGLKSLLSVPVKIFIERPHVVHVQFDYLSFGSPYFTFLFMLSVFIGSIVAGSKNIVTLHTHLSRPEVVQKIYRLPAFLIRLSLLIFIKTLSLFSSKIIVHTKDAKKVLIEDYNLDPFKVAVLPIGIRRFKSLAKEDAMKMLGLEGKHIITTHGIIRKGKGIEQVINAMPQILSKYPNTLYSIVGPMEHPLYEASIKSLAEKLEVTDKVHLHSKNLSNEELSIWLNASDAILLLHETIGKSPSGTLLDAMALGKPVIVSRSARFEDLETVFKRFSAEKLIVNTSPNSHSESVIDQIFEAVDFIFQERALVESISESLKDAVKDLTWDRVAERTVNLYESVI